MSLAYNSDPPFSTATKTRPGKTFLPSSPFSKIYPPLNFSPLLSFLSSRPQCFPCARKSQCFEHSYLALLKRFAVSNISRDITAVLWTLPPSQLETERNHLPGVTKERGKSWISKGEGGREGDARVDGWKGRVSSSDIYATIDRSGERLWSEYFVCENKVWSRTLFEKKKQGRKLFETVRLDLFNFIFLIIEGNLMLFGIRGEKLSWKVYCKFYTRGIKLRDKVKEKVGDKCDQRYR